jgi:putative SOS response-associated peptidase YedK
MCGRYRLSKTERYLLEKFGVRSREDFEWKPRYNIAPTQEVPVIRQDRKSPERTISPMRWGLIPYWAKDAAIGNKMINARSESITEKASFKEAIERRRCLVPADAFYEWKKVSNGTRIVRQPFLINMNDDEAFAFAGVWDRWKSPEGKVVESFSILTTDANAVTRDVHDRMPVIVPPEQYDLWLDPGFRNAEEIKSMLKPYDDAQMQKVPVSTRVNSPDNDDAECSVPIAIENQPKSAKDERRGHDERQDSLF